MRKKLYRYEPYYPIGTEAYELAAAQLKEGDQVGIEWILDDVADMIMADGTRVLARLFELTPEEAALTYAELEALEDKIPKNARNN